MWIAVIAGGTFSSEDVSCQANTGYHLSLMDEADEPAYMLQKSDSAVGPSALPARAEALSTMTILEKKP